MKPKQLRTFKQPDYTNGLLVFLGVAFAVCAAVIFHLG